MLDAVSEHDKLAVFLVCQGDNKIFKFNRFDESLCVTVEFTPDFLENLNVYGLHRQFCLRCLVAERVHNNCHEEVKEDLYTENDEANEKDVCDRRIAALVGHEAVLLVLLILHFRDALERDLIAAPKIEHQRVPALTCCASEQQQERV